MKDLGIRAICRMTPGRLSLNHPGKGIDGSIARKACSPHTSAQSHTNTHNSDTGLQHGVSVVCCAVPLSVFLDSCCVRAGVVVVGLLGAVMWGLEGSLIRKRL